LKPLGVRPAPRDYVANLWARRDFIVALHLGQLSSRNADTALGSLWHLLNPLALAATYYVVFGVLFNARADVDNYVGFLITGLFVFHFGQKCVTGGAGTIVSNAGIIQNISLVRAAFPLGAVLAEVVAHVPSLAILLVILASTGDTPTVTWLLLPLAVALQTAFNLGLSLLVSRLAFYFRDVQNLLPFVMRLWLYVSGVFFTVDRVPDGLASTLFELNPMHVFIDLHRQVLMTGDVQGETLLLGTCWALAVLAFGAVFFWLREQSYGHV
jgi:teichoic acid transport system permease protein